MSELGVVHIVRARNGVDPVRRFLASYLENPAGTEHDLVIVYKGFGPHGADRSYRELLARVSHRSIEVADAGFDIGAYLTAARTCSHRYLCFLNSFSVILAHDWLRYAHELISQRGVGLVGASGSWESRYSNHVRSRNPQAPWVQRIAHAVQGIRLRATFNPFPNHHIRTNAFIVDRERFIGMGPGSLPTKLHAYRFESGKRSMTRQILHMNLKALVVGRDARGYERHEWPHSRTFRAGRQENLLVADNQTNAFMAADPALKRALARYAWADDTEP